MITNYVCVFEMLVSKNMNNLCGVEIIARIWEIIKTQYNSYYLQSLQQSHRFLEY